MTLVGFPETVLGKTIKWEKAATDTAAFSWNVDQATGEAHAKMNNGKGEVVLERVAGTELLDGSSAIRKLSQKNSLLNPRSLPTSLTARIPAEMCHQLLAESTTLRFARFED